MPNATRLLNRRLLSAAAGLLAVLATAADWPQFLGPARNGTSPETGLLTIWPAAGPPRLWEKPLGAGFSGPVVAGGRVLIFHRVGDQEVVQSLEAATGREQWRFAYPTRYQDDFGMDEGPRSTPVVAGGRVYTLGAEGRLHCLDVETGRKVWERSLNDDYQVRKGFFGVATSPLVEGDLLLVNVGGKAAGIVALARDTGKEVWRATDHEASYASPVAATLGGKRRAVFFTREGVVLLDPRTGTVEYSRHWRSRQNASVNAASPLVVGDDVFVSACYGTGALLLHVGPERVDEVWHGEDALQSHYNTPVYADGHLYGSDGRQEQGARLRCVEFKTGKVRWTREGFGCATLVLADGNLLALTEDGELVLVEAAPAAYHERARAAVLTKPCRAQLALADGRLFARDGKRLVCWNLRK